jgi:hypothetical protein
MTKIKKSAKKPNAEKLAERVHGAYHFLTEWAAVRDADEWRKNYVRKAIKILYPDDRADLATNHNVSDQPADVLEKRISDAMQYLLEAGTEGGRNEDDLFRYHVLNAVGILGGSTVRDPIYYR